MKAEVKKTSLLTIEGMRVEFASRRGHVVAVERLDLSVEPGEILGVVGESGAGKSTIGNAVIGLLEPPGEMTAGTILLKGDRIDDLDDAGKRKMRGARIGMIFQDPLTSLNPLLRIGDQLVEVLILVARIAIPQGVVVRAFDDRDGIDLDIAEVFERGQRC